MLKVFQRNRSLYQFLRCFHHFVRGEAVELIQMFREVGRLAELTRNSKRLDAMRDAGA